MCGEVRWATCAGYRESALEKLGVQDVDVHRSGAGLTEELDGLGYDAIADSRGRRCRNIARKVAFASVRVAGWFGSVEGPQQLDEKLLASAEAVLLLQKWVDRRRDPLDLATYGRKPDLHDVNRRLRLLSGLGGRVFHGADLETLAGGCQRR